MLEQLENLHKLCFPHKPWSANDFADLKKSGCDIIASENGFAVWRAVADEAEIITIGVNPEYRKNGIATAMLTLIENELKKSGVKKIFLEVSVNNIPALNLYKSNGYTEFYVRKKYYDDGSDAILMQKILSD